MIDESRTQRQDASAMETVRARASWLEERGWKIGDDGLWRHSTKAADIGLTHSRAFTVQARSGEAGSTLDAGPVAPTHRPAELSNNG